MMLPVSLAAAALPVAGPPEALAAARLAVAVAAALALAMAGAWAVARRPGLSGWTDVVWSYAVGAAGVAAALVPLAPGAGIGWRQGLVAGLAAAWSLRLGTHILLRTRGGKHGGGGDDPRYKALREEWGDKADARLFVFLQVQAVCGWLLAVAMFVAARNPAAGVGWSDVAGALLLAGAVLGEGVADAQLTRFRADPAHKGQVCEAGLWGLSRHPNYFFEWLGWVAYAVIAIGPAGAWWPGWLALAGPALMYVLLVHASGIPPLEAHMLRSRGDAYRATMARVRPFWPIPRRR